MNNIRSHTDRASRITPSSHVYEAEFPSARYFQTHFEYLYETLAAITQELVVLRKRIDGLEANLRSEQTDVEPVLQWLEKRREN